MVNEDGSKTRCLYTSGGKPKAHMLQSDVCITESLHCNVYYPYTIHLFPTNIVLDPLYKIFHLIFIISLQFR